MYGTDDASVRSTMKLAGAPACLGSASGAGAVRSVCTEAGTEGAGTLHEHECVREAREIEFLRPAHST